MNNLSRSICDYEFDQELLKNKFIEKHDFLLPFIGKDYNKYRIMIIAESHYLSENKSVDLTNWYDDCFAINTIHPLDKRNITTRVVVGNWFSGYDKVQPIFDKISSSFCEAIKVNDSKNNKLKVFDLVCFYNFFQRPEYEKGKGLKPNHKDVIYANLIFDDYVRILNPKHIIFVSKKAYNCLKNKKVVSLSLRHPSSYRKWWTKKVKDESSEEVFKKYVEENFHDLVIDYFCESTVE